MLRPSSSTRALRIRSRLKASGHARALTDEFRLIFADHRGQGRSDKPTDIDAYALATRAADAVAVLDALNIDRAHFLGSSWGARLGFALGKYAPERLLSLVLCGNQPYEWNLSSPTAQAVAAAVEASRRDGMTASLSASSRRSAIGSRNRTAREYWR